MRVITVTYRANNPQPGYKTEHAEVAVEVLPGEDPGAAMALAKAEVARALGLDVTKDQAEAALAIVNKARKAGILPARRTTDQI